MKNYWGNALNSAGLKYQVCQMYLKSPFQFYGSSNSHFHQPLRFKTKSMMNVLTFHNRNPPVIFLLFFQETRLKRLSTPILFGLGSSLTQSRFSGSGCCYFLFPLGSGIWLTSPIWLAPVSDGYRARWHQEVSQTGLLDDVATDKSSQLSKGT